MNAPDPKACPKCGAPLPADAPRGLCPSCLLAMNLTSDTMLTGDTVSPPQAPLTPEEIAPSFPQLEILECLGRGGMGVVYKARQKSLGRLVALKLLAPERKGDAQFAERFTREAQALAQLDHPHIVTVYDFGQANGFFYLLMEFVDGVNLRELLRARKLTPEEALSIVPPICDALQFAHERGIVHRDIKPENLLLGKGGQIKIADFGIAKMLGVAVPPAADEQAAGTPGYMAPEQMDAPQRSDRRADIYSLGVVLYEMLTGELPAKKIQPPSRKVTIDVRLDDVVLRALEREPERRYQTADEMRTRVEAVVQKPVAQDVAQSDEGKAASSRFVNAALLLTWGFTGFMVFAALFQSLRLSHPIVLAAMIAFLGAVIGTVPGATLVRRWKKAPREPHSNGTLWLKAFAGMAMFIGLIAICFGTFFVIAMVSERGGWSPGVDEAIFVILSWAGMILLPLSANQLWLAAREQEGGVEAKPTPARVMLGNAALVLAVLVPMGAILLQYLALTNEAATRQLRLSQVRQELVELNMQLEATRNELNVQETRAQSAIADDERLRAARQAESLREKARKFEDQLGRVQNVQAEISKPLHRTANLTLAILIGLLLAVVGWVARQHPSGSATLQSAMQLNPGPRRIFWLICILIILPVVLIFIGLLVPKMAQVGARRENNPPVSISEGERTAPANKPVR